MVTICPGPASLKLFKELTEVQECSAVHFFADYEASFGNYIVDAVSRKPARAVVAWHPMVI